MTSPYKSQQPEPTETVDDLMLRDRFVRARLVDDVFVARRAAGMTPGIGDKAAPKPQLAFPPPHRIFVEVRRRQVPMHRAEMAHSLFVEVEAGGARGRLFLRLVQASLLRRPAGGSAAEPLLLHFVRKIVRAPWAGKPYGLRRNRR